MPESNAIKAGGAYVTVSAKNNVGPGLAAASAEVKKLGSIATTSMDAATKAALEHLAAVKRGEQVTRQNLTAQETHAGKISELNDLLGRGVISQDTFARATNKAGKELKKASEGAKSSGDELFKIPPVLGKVMASMALLKVASGAIFAISGGKAAADDLERQLTRMNTLTEKQMATRQKAFEETSTKADFGTQVEQLTHWTSALKDADTQVISNSASLGKLKKEVDDLNNDTVAGYRRDEMPLVGGAGYKQARDAKLAELDAAQKLYDLSKEQQEVAQKKVGGLKDPMRDLQFLTDYNTKLQDIRQSTSAVGLTTEEAWAKKLDDLTKIYPQLKDKAADYNNELVKFKAATIANDVKDLTKSYQEQLDTLGMVSEAADLYKLKIKGATQESLAMAANVAIALTQGKAALARTELQKQFDEKLKESADNMQGRTAVSFGTNNVSGMFNYGGGGQSNNVADIAKAQLDLEKENLKITTQMGLDIAAIRTQGGPSTWGQ